MVKTTNQDLNIMMNSDELIQNSREMWSSELGIRQQTPDCFSKCLKQRNICNFINAKPFLRGFANMTRQEENIGSSLNQNWNHEESATLSFIYKGPYTCELLGAHTHTLDKKWIIEVIRWELNPLTCS